MDLKNLRVLAISLGFSVSFTLAPLSQEITLNDGDLRSMGNKVRVTVKPADSKDGTEIETEEKVAQPEPADTQSSEQTENASAGDTEGEEAGSDVLVLGDKDLKGMNHIYVSKDGVSRETTHTRTTRPAVSVGPAFGPGRSISNKEAAARQRNIYNKMARDYGLPTNNDPDFAPTGEDIIRLRMQAQRQRAHEAQKDNN